LKDRMRNLSNFAFQLLSPSRPMFHAHVFDPPLIVAQIFALQSCYWFIYSVVTSLSCFLFGLSLSLGRMFDCESLQYQSNSFSFANVLSFFGTSFLSSYMMVVVVERSKKCLDFAATVHIFHFFVVFSYSSLPGFSWWFCWSLSLFLMFVVGQSLCRKWEMEVIELSSAKKADPIQV